MLTNDDNEKQKTFYESMLEMVEDDETLFSRLGLSNEATFYLCSTVDRRNVHNWGTRHSNETIQHQRDSSKVNIFCLVPQEKVYGLFFFEETPLQNKAI